MGYRTYHSFEIIEGDLNRRDEMELELEDNYDVTFNDDCKWYDREADMKEFSEKYPDYVFAIHGDGEESDDKWVEFWKNGLSYGASKYIEPEFDPKRIESTVGKKAPKVKESLIVFDFDNCDLIHNTKTKKVCIFTNESAANKSAKIHKIKNYQVITLEP